MRTQINVNSWHKESAFDALCHLLLEGSGSVFICGEWIYDFDRFSFER